MKRGHSCPLVVLLLMLFGTFAHASTPSFDFDQANRLYEQGQYKEAISQYEALLKSGRASAAVFFNIGNACFKNGEIGRAIYNYRRAQALAPRDPDIQANLRFARERIAGSASAQPPVWAQVAGYFTVNEMAAVAALFFWMTLLLLTAMRWRPALRPFFRPYVSSSTILLVVSAVWLAATYANSQERTAIAVRSQVPIHLGPITESQAAFIVPDGTELRVENQRDNWLQVVDRSNRSGWVEASQVALLP